MTAQVIDIAAHPAFQADDTPRPRTPPGPAIIEPFPTGLRVLADVPALAFRVAQLLAGRDAHLTFAQASGWRGLGPFAIWNVKTPALKQAGACPPIAQRDMSWVCAVHLPNAFPFPAFARALQAEGVTLITPASEVHTHG